MNPGSILGMDRNVGTGHTYDPQSHVRRPGTKLYDTKKAAREKAMAMPIIRSIQHVALDAKLYIPVELTKPRCPRV